MVLQQALADANTACRNFFASAKGIRKGRRVGTPRFRSKRDRTQSIRFTRAARFRITAIGFEARLGPVLMAIGREVWNRYLPSYSSCDRFLEAS